MKIFVIFNAEAFTLEDIEPSDSIQSVKTKIEAKKGIPPADQIIYIAPENRPLGDDTTLADLSITISSKYTCWYICISWVSIHAFSIFTV